MKKKKKKNDKIVDDHLGSCGRGRLVQIFEPSSHPIASQPFCQLLLSLLAILVLFSFRQLICRSTLRYVKIWRQRSGGRLLR